MWENKSKSDFLCIFLLWDRIEIQIPDFLRKNEIVYTKAQNTQIMYEMVIREIIIFSSALAHQKVRENSSYLNPVVRITIPYIICAFFKYGIIKNCLSSAACHIC